MDLEKIGMYIAKCRKEMNLTQEELGEKLGITSKAVSKWECGRGLPDISIMLELCYLLGINIISLLMGEDSNTEYNIQRTGGSMTRKKANKITPGKYPNVENLSKEKITKIKDIKNPKQTVTIEGKVKGFFIRDDNYIIRCNLEVSDDTETINVVLKDNRNIELKQLIRRIEVGKTYRMKGSYNLNPVYNEKILLVKTIEEI